MGNGRKAFIMSQSYLLTLRSTNDESSENNDKMGNGNSKDEAGSISGSSTSSGCRCKRRICVDKETFAKMTEDEQKRHCVCENPEDPMSECPCECEEEQNKDGAAAAGNQEGDNNGQSEDNK